VFFVAGWLGGGGWGEGVIIDCCWMSCLVLLPSSHIISATTEPHAPPAINPQPTTTRPLHQVGSSTAKAAEMAAKLSAQHRWAVTGTPISRGLEDLYGLLYFLGAAPWDDRRWWSAALQVRWFGLVGVVGLEATMCNRRRPAQGWRCSVEAPGCVPTTSQPNHWLNHRRRRHTASHGTNRVPLSAVNQGVRPGCQRCCAQVGGV